MKKLIVAILSIIVLAGAITIVGYAADAPTIVSVHITDAETKTVEINFSEPVNIKNLGWMVAVNQSPNGSNPYATFDWGKMTFHLYGCVDSNGNTVGENGYVCNTSGDAGNVGIYTTRLVTYLGEIGQQAEGGSTVNDLKGIEFQNLNQGLFTTPDGRSVSGNSDGKLYVEFTQKQTAPAQDNKNAPKITSAHIVDAESKAIEINFSEPVNIKNLGWMVAVNQFPNGSNPYATFDWSKMTFHLYGCVDSNGNTVGENGYVCNTSGDAGNVGIYTTRLVTYLGEIGQQAEGGSTVNDLKGIEFQNLNQGLFTTPDGRTVQGDSDGKLYVEFTEKQNDSPSTSDTLFPIFCICMVSVSLPFFLRKKRAEH